MKIEQNDSSLILSQTSIPDVFFTEYLSQASGDAIKVYLYLYFLSKYGKDIKINDLAKKLDLSLKAIQDSIKYWESVGLLIRKNQGFIIANIQEIEINKLYKPKVTISPEHLDEIKENKSRAMAIDTINNEFFQGVMSPSWYSEIDLWFKKYGFSEEVMIALFRFCFNKSALYRNYITTVAEGWFKNNVKTFNDLDLYFQKEEKVKTIESSIKRKLRLPRNLSIYEEAYVEKWNITYGYDMSIIDIALKQTTTKYNVSFDYFDKLLTDWHERGFINSSQIESYIASQKTKPVQKAEKKSTTTSGANFAQREYTDLDNFYINVNK